MPKGQLSCNQERRSPHCDIAPPFDFSKAQMNRSGEIFDNDDELYDEFEEWEEDVYYLEEKDYWGLLKYRKNYAQRRPHDLYAQIRLGEAYNLVGDYQAAIDFCSKFHRRYPKIPDFQHVILDALFATNRTESDFNWTRKPTIIRLTSAVLDWCYDYLQPKRKPRSIDELYIEFILKGYLCFSEEDLFNALRKDSRFVVEASDDDWVFATVKVARKTR